MKTFKIIIIFTLFIIFSAQASQVLAKHKDKDDDRPVSGPITSPITSPLCKPGFGFGDKNHCHFGPPGHEDLGEFFSEAFGHFIENFDSVFHFHSK